MTPSDRQKRRHQEALRYTEKQARLLFIVRDMVKQEVKRQLEDMFKASQA